MKYILILRAKNKSGCRKNTHGTKVKLLIDKLLLLDSRAKHKNQELLWIDYKKAYDSVLHSWIWKCLQMFKISDNDCSLFLASGHEDLADALVVW